MSDSNIMRGGPRPGIGLENQGVPTQSQESLHFPVLLKRGKMGGGTTISIRFLLDSYYT